jgi:predicted metal-dependent hydrolase
MLPFEYTVRISHRAKKIRIIVTPEKIELVSPIGVSKEKLHLFVKKHQDWVDRTSLKLKEKKKIIKTLALDCYVDGALVPFKGRQVKIRLKESPNKREQVTIQLDGEELIVSLPLKFTEQDNKELIRSALIGWMKQQALESVKLSVDKYAPIYGLYPRSFKIKSQKSLWGSCGIHDDININWLLVLAPPEVMEYVVVHEICHIKERNHSVRFWILVNDTFSSYQKQRDWLKINGASLVL